METAGHRIRTMATLCCCCWTPLGLAMPRAVASVLYSSALVMVMVELLAVGPSLAAAQNWMSLSLVGSAMHVSSRSQCDYLTELTAKQRKLCKDHTELMSGVVKGAVVSLRECRYQFRWRRWNCSTVADLRGDNSPFGIALNTGTREAAYVHAIFSAGVGYAVTRECSRGAAPSKCACAVMKGDFVDENGAFKWHGCSENTDFGMAFSKAFVDGFERERNRGTPTHQRYLMNLHNNEAGRQVVVQNMELKCRCHGVSGSCATRTCAKIMPSFRSVGNLLKNKFDSASLVNLELVGARRVLLPVNKQFKPLTVSDLVYLEQSPSFCDYDPGKGSLGTRGRSCNRQSSDTDGCALLCCDRGFETHDKEVVDKCRCKFYWCCVVTCEDCRTRKRVHTCL